MSLSTIATLAVGILSGISAAFSALPFGWAHITATAITAGLAGFFAVAGGMFIADDINQKKGNSGGSK